MSPEHVLLSKDYQLKGAGSNECGQLGKGKEEDYSSTFLRVPFDGDPISHVFASEYISVLFTNKGDVLACGYAGNNELGKDFGKNNETGEDSSPKIVYEPQQLNPKGTSIKAIAIGEGHTLFLSTKGDVYGSGSNKFFQLGFDKDNDPSVYTFEPLNLSSKVKQIAAANNNSFILTEEGVLLGCGRNFYGQLGLKHRNPVHQFTKIPSPDRKKIEKIVVSFGSSFLLTEDGQVYGCGQSDAGELGVKTGTAQVPDFTRVRLPEGVKIKHLIAGNGFVLALSTENVVFGWGSGHSGVLGPEHVNKQNVVPQPIQLGDSPIIGMYSNNKNLAVFVNTKNEVIVLGRATQDLTENIKKELSEFFASQFVSQEPGIKRSSKEKYADIVFFSSQPTTSSDLVSSEHAEEPKEDEEESKGLSQ